MFARLFVRFLEYAYFDHLGIDCNIVLGLSVVLLTEKQALCPMLFDGCLHLAEGLSMFEELTTFGLPEVNSALFFTQESFRACLEVELSSGVIWLR